MSQSPPSDRNVSFRQSDANADAGAHIAEQLGNRIAATFGQVVGVMMRAPQYRHAFLSDLEWLVLPPLANGQFALAEARHKESGLAAPVAVVLWATVSDEVDARLSSNPGGSLRLKPAEWKSGDNAWLVEAIGDARAVQALISQTLAGPLQGRGLKLVTRDADGKAAVKVMRANGAAAGAPTSPPASDNEAAVGATG